MDQGLGKRIFDFTVDIIKYCRSLPRGKEYEIIKSQLIRSSTSVGANYEEAQAASSRADFINKVKISLKEARESNYWIRILVSLTESDTHLDNLLTESKELMNILGAISAKSSLKK